MSYEIELKAWVSDWKVIEAYLRQRCDFVREFRKSDRYFRSRSGKEEETWFRLRSDGAAAVVTFKEKRYRGGMEFNREREFTVSDAEAFLEMVMRLETEEYATKVKTGLEFRSDGMTVELSHVENVGDFLEIEVISQSADEGVHDEIAGKIRSFLGECGISEEMMEDASYVSLLRRNEVSKDAPRA